MKEIVETLEELDTCVLQEMLDSLNKENTEKSLKLVNEIEKTLFRKKESK